MQVDLIASSLTKYRLTSIITHMNTPQMHFFNGSCMWIFCALGQIDGSRGADVSRENFCKCHFLRLQTVTR